MFSRRNKPLLLIFTLLLISVLAACSSTTGAQEKDGKVNTGLDPDTIVNTAFKDLYPLEYDTYVKNMESDEVATKFTEDIEPYLPILFHNYGFSGEYNKTRGHTFAIDDIIKTSRINDDSIGACMTCKSPAVPHLIDEMGDDYWGANFRDEVLPRTIEMGEGGEAEELGEYGHLAIGCADCHDPVTMDLRITRPSFTEAMDRRGIDVTEASKNDMRSYVCGQCHVEYYFEPEHKKVTFPWDEGLTAEDTFEYFETLAKEEGFDYDWVSSISGAPMLKAQHPEFETWSNGPHGQADVSCADCHMPYERSDGKKKIVSHNWSTSPMDAMEQSCRTCHNDKSEKYLTERVEDIQTRHLEALEETQLISVEAHYYVNRMITAGAPKERIEEAQFYVRKGQWFWDFIAAENSDGFHNPQGGMDAMRDSSDASNKAIKIATTELTKLDVDLEELDQEIDKVVDNVLNEDDPFKKKEHAVNEYFPNVLELE